MTKTRQLHFIVLNCFLELSFLYPLTFGAMVVFKVWNDWCPKVRPLLKLDIGVREAAQTGRRTGTAVGADLQLADVTLKLPSLALHSSSVSLVATKMWPWD